MSTETTLRDAILALLDERAPGATICPSEAARRVDPEDWRTLMGPTRDAARALIADGRIEMTQHGESVDPATARGPVRLRARHPGSG